MTETAIAALTTAGASLIVAFVSSGIALWNRSKTNENSLEIQELKSAVDRDLERLKAKLSHGQMVSSTQWTAEFNSYQAIWKGMVAIRTLANKIVHRESELIEHGVPDGYLTSPKRIEIRKDLISKFVKAGQDLLLAIHDNAPFYPAAIRNAADNTHRAAKGLMDKQLNALARLIEGVDITMCEQFTAESESIRRTIIEGVDLVESLIRDRLAAVEVVNSIRG